MTDKEKKALEKAFDIPEPDRKKEFIEEFSKLSENDDKKPLFPVIMRFAAAAAMFAVIIGVLTHMPKDNVDFGKGNGSDLITATEASSETTGALTSSVTVTTAKSVKTDSETTTVSAVVTTKSTTADKNAASTATGTAKQTTAANTTAKTASTTRTVATTVTEHVKTTSATTTKVESKPEDRPATTTVKNDSPPKTTTVKGDGPPATTTRDERTETVVIGRNMTVSPDIIYNVRSKTVPEEEMYHQKESGDQQGPSQSKPIDAKAMLKEMYNDSSAVVLAKADEMVYTSIDDNAVTAENLTVKYVYKGELVPNDRITAFFSGGYIPAEIYIENHEGAHIDSAEKYSVYEMGTSKFRQNEGDQYIFFIRNTDDKLPNGAYSPVREGNIAVFKIISGNCVSVDDSRLFFSEDDLKNLG